MPAVRCSVTKSARDPLRVWWRGGVAGDAFAALANPETIVVHTDPDAVPVDVGPIDVLVDGTPSDEALDVPGLKHVIVPYAGIRPTLVAQLRTRPHLTLHNSHFNAAFVAQHALALLLSSAQRLTRYDRALREGNWLGGERQADARDRWDAQESTFLPGARALLLGYGAIARALTPLLQGIGMDVQAIRRQPRDDDPIPTRSLDRLHDALGEADAIIVTLPATPDTERLLDAAAYAHVKRGALLVNVGRGSVLDEQATWDALNDGTLGGLGLDVWWNYPEDRKRAGTVPTLPSNLPFHEHPDVILSPHRANATRGWREASARDVLATILALRDGVDRNRVDLDAGY